MELDDKEKQIDYDNSIVVGREYKKGGNLDKKGGELIRIPAKINDSKKLGILV